jgi:polyribonucleotide nucleotidyltransferase
MQITTYSMPFGAKTLYADFTDLSPQANGSVLIRYGETAILVTAVMGERETVGSSHFPLSVEFAEKLRAADDILGRRFAHRESRPSDEAVLSARIVDRTIRPLFSQHLKREVQIVVTVLAVGEDDPDVLAVIGASLALGASDIPWDGPVGAVRLARAKTDNAIVINPTNKDRADGRFYFEILACGRDRAINMIELAANEVAEKDVAEALEAAVVSHGEFERFADAIIKERGRAKRALGEPPIHPSLDKLFTASFSIRLKETLFSKTAGKHHLCALGAEFETAAKALGGEAAAAGCYFRNKLERELHRGIVTEGKRPDGRGLADIRPLYAQAGGLSPALHGSGLFYRGDTHVLSTLTLGGAGAAQILDAAKGRAFGKRFVHHYNFPPFSVGEIGRVGVFNRRMIGHGALAEKALAPVIPTKEVFPHTIHLVSETLSSNGSSSMGSVCASSLALMDGGVPITRHVAGVALGLMSYAEAYAILTDIQGPEDDGGDMDLKVAGTEVGITAIQMDVKTKGVPVGVLKEALAAARTARLSILDSMRKAIAEPRAQLTI